MKGWSFTYFSGVPGSTQNLLTSILTDLWFCEKGFLLDLVMLHSSSNQLLFWTFFGGQQNSAAMVLVSPLMTNGWTMWYFAVSAWPLAMNSLLSNHSVYWNLVKKVVGCPLPPWKRLAVHVPHIRHDVEMLQFCSHFRGRAVATMFQLQTQTLE